VNTFTTISIHFLPLVFVIKNRDFFQSNSEIHNINTRFNHNLHLPSTNLTLVQKVVLYSGSKIYNHLPSNIKALSNDAKHFKHTLKNYLIEHSFYSLDEFYISASWQLQLSFFTSLLLSFVTQFTCSLHNQEQPQDHIYYY